MKIKILLAMFFSFSQTVFANYTVSGTFQYRDLTISINGFTNPKPFRPVRFVDVAIKDANSNQTLATTYTNADGFFSVNVVDSQTRNLSVLAVANTTAGQPYNIKVVEYASFGNGPVHAFELDAIPNHSPTQNINLGTVNADYHNGGETFNLFDCAVDGINFLASLGETNPWSSLTIKFTLDNSNFAFASGGSVNIGGLYGYDDTILLHEMGHWCQFNFGGFSDNPGGTHFIGDSNQDPRLSFGEGWPTFWGTNVRNYYNLQGIAGYSKPNIYFNSNGDSTSGVYNFSYDLETSADANNSQQGNGGASNEVSVQAALWDLTDNANTDDYSQGVEDETGFELSQSFQSHWNFIKTYLAQPPFSGQIAFDDYFMLWNANATNPETIKFQQMIITNHNFEYYSDSFENDNNANEALPLSVVEVGEGKMFYQTIYPLGDSDWKTFNAIAGITYQVSTSNLNNGLDTYLYLKDTSGTALVQNNNSTSTTYASTVSYTPTTNQILYSHVTIPTSPEPYAKLGGYTFAVSITNVPSTFPNIVLNPSGVVFQVANTTTGYLPIKKITIQNSGTSQNLTYTMETLDYYTLQPATFNWFSVSSPSGTLNANQLDTLSINFNANFAVSGINRAKLRINTNDPDNPQHDLSVNLNNLLPSGVLESESLTRDFKLSQNFPNPFNPTTKIAYELKAKGKAKLTIFNVVGEVVREFELENQNGFVEWNGKNSFGKQVSSGIYFYRLEAGNFSEVKKMLLLK
ncbi:T9SS type A sorting domain-containing protein [bacterium]|nr:T9SS type A sorting domain-containing protein [bacterium]